MDQEPSVFSTQDLNLAAVLFVNGFVLQNISKDSKGKATFSYIKNSLLNKTIQDFWNNKLLINPQDLFHALKVLKNRIYSSF
mgnify:CR=1 FL=1